MPKKGKKKGRRHHHHVHHNHQGKGGHMRAARGHKRAAKFAHGANKKIHHLKAAQHRRKARAKQNKERRQRIVMSYFVGFSAVVAGFIVDEGEDILLYVYTLLLSYYSYFNQLCCTIYLCFLAS